MWATRVQPGSRWAGYIHSMAAAENRLGNGCIPALLLGVGLVILAAVVVDDMPWLLAKALPYPERGSISQHLTQLSSGMHLMCAGWTH